MTRYLYQTDRRYVAQIPAGMAELATAELFRKTHDFLGVAGYEHYEISNFSRGTRWRSAHNQKYWNFTPYVGLGPGAHSFNMPERWWNHSDINRYMEDVKAGTKPVAELEELNEEQQMMEALYLGLRQADGLELEQFVQEFHIDFKPFIGPYTCLCQMRGD